jgi:hypothetical protein
MSEKPTGPLPFPGAAPTVSGIPARTFVVGRFAICAIGGVAVANLFDWEVNVNFDYADATAHGDRWKQKVFLDADWPARARGYVTAASTNQYILASTSGAVPSALTFTGYSDMTLMTKLWEGPCLISRGRISAPMAMVEQEFELVSNGVPTAGLG